MQNCKLYYSQNTEVFEYVNTIAGRARERLTLPFLESILSFLELNLAQMTPTCTHAIDFWNGFFKAEGINDAKRATKVLEELSNKHIYFKMLYMKWYNLYAKLCFENTSNDPEIWHQMDKLWSMPEQWVILQKQVLHFVENVLDIDRAGRDTQRQMAVWYERSEQRELIQLFSSPISISIKCVEQGSLSPVLYSSSISDMMVFSLRTCVDRGITVRRCKNCGRYFPQIGRVSAEYCARPAQEGTTICKEIGAFQQWAKKHEDDPILRVYRREYKKRFSWIKAGRISRADFLTWSKLVRKKKKDCEGGSVSLAEFEDWLKKSQIGH